MSIYSIADLHLSTVVNKPMDIFGNRWASYTDKLVSRWNAIVNPEDTVIIPGDISWGMSLEEAMPDFRLINSLPGKKLIGKGNHDYWWTTMTKMKGALEDAGLHSIEFLFNNAYAVEDCVVCGTRGWYVEDKVPSELSADYQKIVAREQGRLEMSLREAVKLRKTEDTPILVYLHFPPVFKSFVCRELIDTMHRYGATKCYFGHIHGVYNVPRTTEFEGISLTLIAADFLDFVPMITVPYDY